MTKGSSLSFETTNSFWLKTSSPFFATTYPLRPEFSLLSPEKSFGGRKSFLWGHWHSCFGLLVMSLLGFKTSGIPHLCALSPACNGFLRFTSSVTPANLLVARMAANAFTHLLFKQRWIPRLHAPWTFLTECVRYFIQRLVNYRTYSKVPCCACVMKLRWY